MDNCLRLPDDNRSRIAVVAKHHRFATAFLSCKPLLLTLFLALLMSFASFTAARAQAPTDEQIFLPFVGQAESLEGIPIAPRGALGGPTPLVAGIAEEYYIPLAEPDLLRSFAAINIAADPPGATPAQRSVQTVVSIAIGASLIIYYDQHEDGYETDISNPTDVFYQVGPGCPGPSSANNLDGTQIWGNNNICDGIPPSFAIDTLTNGNVIVLANTVPVVNPGTLFDGGDRFGSTLPVAVSRLGWTTLVGTLMAGAVGVLNTNAWGTTFQMPVGENVTSPTQAWEYTVLYVMAGYNDTLVYRNGALQGELERRKSLL